MEHGHAGSPVIPITKVKDPVLCPFYGIGMYLIIFLCFSVTLCVHFFLLVVCSFRTICHFLELSESFCGTPNMETMLHEVHGQICLLP